jgi:N-acetyl-alpha-D-glucosaminyl L-malate synthase BshA
VTRLRVAIVCFPGLGGSGRVAVELAGRLCAYHHEVTLVSSELPDGMRTGLPPSVRFSRVEVASYPLFEHAPYTLAVASQLVRLGRESGLDVIHVHYALPHAAAAMLARDTLQYEGKGRVPCVCTLHGTDVTRAGPIATYEPLLAYSVASCDAITVPSRFLEAEARARLSLPDSMAIHRIPNFVDAERFTPAASAAAPRLGPLRLVHVSNLRPVKRVDDVLEAMRRARSPTTLTVVGEGPERERLQARAQALGVDARFVGRRDDVPELLRSADAFVFPSDVESFGLAALEASAAGIPVVATRTGGVPEVIRDGVTGLLSEVGDVAGLAAHLDRLAADPELARRLGQAGRRLALEWSPEPAVAAYAQLYQSLVRDGT